ncbi:MAG: tetratricopeptide repeat protein [Myxococcota bacterium]|nr:tetratricopeptide repeat protein [Myxococcota bacterium]
MPTHPLHAALALHKSGRLDDARLAYERMLSTSPEHVEALNLLGVLHLQQGRAAQAAAVLGKAASKRPDRSDIHNNFGNALRAQGDRQGAIAAWEKALHIDPADADAWCNLGVARIEGGDVDAAAAAWERAIAANPTHADAIDLLAVSRSQRGAHAEAIALWRRALSVRPGHLRSRENLAAALQQQGAAALSRSSAAEALSLLDESIRLSPQDPAGHLFRSDALRQLGRLRDAFESCQDALQLDPSRPEVHHNIGNLFKETGQNDQAIAAYQKALALGSTHPATKLALDALTGATPDAAPQAVVRDLFDSYADRFDAHLVEELGYRTPTLLRQLYDRVGGGEVRRLLDLGCGTGLSGEAFSDTSAEMIGVDLSGKMVATAREKGLYTRLHVGEVVRFLEASTARFELILAADVLVYIGDLSPLMAAAAARCKNGARFLLSVEQSEQAGFHLQKSERFAHSSDYVRQIAADHGFTVEASERSQLRKDEGRWISGELFCLRR